MIESTIIVELQNVMGSDREIAEAAWTSSYNKETKEKKSDEDVARLVKRLILDGHCTPIESVIFKFWMRIPVMIDRQIMTYRQATHNGLSGRYRTMPSDYYHIPPDVEAILDRLPDGDDIIADYESSCALANENYSIAINALKDYEKHGSITNSEYKRCREILRAQLPTAGMTERVSIFNLRSLANFFKQRLSDHAQPEIREVAQQMLQQIIEAQVCPVAIETLQSIGWNL